MKKRTSGIEWIEIEGKKVPYCCMAIKNEEKCDYETRAGKKCAFSNFKEEEFKKVNEKLAKELS